MHRYAGHLLLFILLVIGFSPSFAQDPAPPVPAAPPQLAPPRQMIPTGDSAADTPLPLVEFRDVPLIDAMRLLSIQSGLRIVPSAEAGKTIVSLYLRDVTPLTAVASITQANALIYRREPDTGIVRIFTTKENTHYLTAFREDKSQVFTLLYPNALSVATAIRDLFGEQVRLSYGVDDYRTFDDLRERFDRFDLINSRSIGLNFSQGGGTGTLGGGIGTLGGGIGAYGGGSGAYGGGLGASGGGYGRGTVGGGSSGGVRPSDTLSATRAQQQRPTSEDQRYQGLTAEEIQELENAFVNKEAPDRTTLLELLRRRPATIYVTVIRQHNQLIVRTSDTTTMTQIQDLVGRLDVPTPVVLLEVKVLSINLTDTFNSLFDFQFTDGSLLSGGFSPATATNSGFTSGNILPPFADQLLSSARRYNTIAPGPLGTSPPNNLMFQIVSAGFRARLQLLEDKNRVTELSSPLLMTANNEVSQIFTGQQVPVTVGFTPAQTLTSTSAATSVQGTPITTLQNIGTTLLITPNINADRTVTLRILQENSKIIPNGGNIPLPNTTGTGFTSIPVDIVQQQSFTGTVVAKDGLTIAVGGLIEEGVNDSRAEVPMIGKVPVLGFFFRQQNTQRYRRELVLLIRPFVLTTPAESTDASKTLLDSLSIHPNILTGNLNTLGTYNPQEVLRPCPPETELQNIFRVHTIDPKRF